MSAPLIVAADGRPSQLRRIAGIKTVNWRADQWGLVATIGLEHAHNATAVQHFLPSGPFAILPLTQNRASLVWSEREDAAKRVAALDDAAFMDHVRQRMGTDYGDLTLAGPRGALFVYPRNEVSRRRHQRLIAAGWRHVVNAARL